MKQLLTVLIIFLSLVCKGQNLIYTDGSQNYLKVPNKKAKVYPPHSHQLGTTTCFTTLPPSYSYQCSVCKKEFNTLGSFFVGGSNAVNNSWYKQVTFDTISVIMLVCDTSLHIYQTKSNFEGMDYYDFDNSVKWTFGYKVTESTYYSIYGKYTYLDADKKELPKSIVVWLSKPN